MGTLLFRLQRLDGLSEQLKPVVLERVIDSRRPLHLAAAAHQVDIVFLVAVDAVSAGFLGRCAGAVRCAEHPGNVFIIRSYRYDTDTDAQPETAVIPHELELVDRRS